MAWIELHQTRQRHPKTLRFAAMIDQDRRYACGLLDDLWAWALDVAERDGRLEGMTSDDIAAAMDYPRKKGKWLMDALVTSGYVDIDGDGTYRLHDWEVYAGKLNDRRQDTKARVERYRERKKAESVTQCNALQSVTKTECNASTVPKPYPTVPKPYQNPKENDAVEARTREGFGGGVPLDAYLSNNLTIMSPGNYAELGEMMEHGMTDEIVRYAVDIATAGNKRTWGFVKFLLNQWILAELKTLGEAKAYETNRKAAQTAKNAKGAKAERVYEDITSNPFE